MIERGYDEFSEHFYLDQLNEEASQVSEEVPEEEEPQNDIQMILDDLVWDYGMENEYAVIDMGRQIPRNRLGVYNGHMKRPSAQYGFNHLY